MKNIGLSLYKITHRDSGKSYIGTSKDVRRRWRHHVSDANNPNTHQYNYPLQSDIRIYGKEAFDFEIIDYFENDYEGLKAEQKAIADFETLVPNGYNQVDGSLESPAQRPDIAKKIRETKRLRQGKRVALVDPKTREIVKIYESLVDAEESIEGSSRFKISLVANGRRKSHKGLFFRFVDRDNNIIEVKYQREYAKNDPNLSEKQQYKRVGIEIQACDPETLEIVHEFPSYAAAARYFKAECGQTIKRKCDNYADGKENILFKDFIWRRKEDSGEEDKV